MKLTRERWLLNVASIVETHLFNANGYIVPKNVRYSCSLPSKGAFGSKLKTIGQCWTDKASKDKTFEIFISPTIADNRLVVATLIHEMVHATVGLQAGHKAPFKRCAISVGLEGKMTATSLKDDVWKQIEPLIKAHGSYPHAELNHTNTKKQGTRMIKVYCPVTDYKVRMSRKQLDEFGAPYCRCCNDIMVEA